MAALRDSLVFLSEQDSVRRLVTRGRVFRPLVGRFVAGQTLDDAIRVAGALNARGIKVTLDHLGENVSNELDATAAADAYIAALESIAGGSVDANVSLKLTQLGLDLGREVCTANLRRVANRARELTNFVRVDMESHKYTQATLDIVEELSSSEVRNVGVVIQSCLYRSAEGVERLNELGIRVRLCKGAYLEPPDVAYPHKRDVDANYRRLAETLLTSGTRPAFATHDEKMIEAVRTHARMRSIDPSRFEFQMLYGIRRDLQSQLAREGFDVRVYVPYGVAWYPYLLMRLAERPVNLAFVLRSLVRPS